MYIIGHIGFAIMVVGLSGLTPLRLVVASPLQLLVCRVLRTLRLLVLMGQKLGKLPVAWEVGQKVIGSHGLGVGKAAHGLKGKRSG